LDALRELSPLPDEAGPAGGCGASGGFAVPTAVWCAAGTAVPAAAAGRMDVEAATVGGVDLEGDAEGSGLSGSAATSAACKWPSRDDGGREGSGMSSAGGTAGARRADLAPALPAATPADVGRVPLEGVPDRMPTMTGDTTARLAASAASAAR